MKRSDCNFHFIYFTSLTYESHSRIFKLLSELSENRISNVFDMGVVSHNWLCAVDFFFNLPVAFKFGHHLR